MLSKNISDEGISFCIAPTEINITAPSDYTIQIKYKPSLSVFPFVDLNITTYDNSSELGLNRIFHAVCQTEGHPLAQGKFLK